MNLKIKISFFVSLLFTIISAISVTAIYLSFADFREDEFESRLKEKAISTIKLLTEVKQIDKQLLKTIDQHSIHKLYDEKVLVFDSKLQLIYSSLDDTKIKWTVEDLEYLKKHKSFFKVESEKEVYGIFYNSDDRDYYIIVSATDNFGKRKLSYLFYLLIASYLIFSVVSWFATYLIIGKLLSPLGDFHKKLKEINENNLDTRIFVKKQKDEIDLLANEFNQMLERIDVSYKNQKEFTANASHELRTPIARMIAQLQNKIIEENNIGGNNNFFYEKLLDGINQLSELINSLLILSKLDTINTYKSENYRLDDVIFESFEKVNKVYEQLKLEINISEVETLELRGNKSLLEIVFLNIFRNAYLYSDNHQVKVNIESINRELVVSVTNTGKTLSEEERNNLFQPFMRGGNSKNISGLGLGLRIVYRILKSQNAKIFYTSDGLNSNTFNIFFPF
ncbi:MAG: sensor histidine kinase [Cytophagales bacterium]|nr:MAG: sensor histidine kinase [Cytophagales bacterium]